MKKRFWIAVVSKEHVLHGVEGNYMQACHGKKAPLAKMKKGDGFLFYSSKISLKGDEKCQAFTAIGEVKDDIVYQFQMSESFIPFRRNIDFFKSENVSILPLIEDLEFIQDKKYWGYNFRYGFLEIGEKDFNFIQSKMRIDEYQ
jgi:hypothetical protein